MIEKGIVKELLDGKRARVYFKAGSDCSKCGACMRAGNAVYIDALNELKAKAGDNVKVEIPPRNVLLASFLLFILPLIALMSGFFIGGVVWSFLFLFITYLLIFIYDRMFHFVSVKSRIVEVL